LYAFQIDLSVSCSPCVLHKQIFASKLKRASFRVFSFL